MPPFNGSINFSDYLNPRRNKAIAPRDMPPIVPTTSGLGPSLDMMRQITSQTPGAINQSDGEYDKSGEIMDADAAKQVFQGIYREHQYDNMNVGQYGDQIGEMPKVPAPAIFKKDPMIVDTPGNAKDIYEAISRIAPQYIDKVKLVSRAPTKTSMQMYLDAGWEPMTSFGTNVRGTTNIPGRDEIFISRDAPNFLKTLIHEMMHIAGQGHDFVYSPAGMETAYPPTPKFTK